ncbi:MAG: hypothetical protein IT384_15080 [Deltaproteobacteria bacterium]|nr:hypothetical protein [Deltaproteobacteria bacterium]
MSRFVKDVAGGEKFFIALNEIRPPFVIQLALEGRGDPSGDELHEALEKTTEANPGSSLVLSGSGDDLKWIVGPPPTLTLLDAPEFTGEHGEDAPFLMWPLDCSKGPTCELVLVRGKTHNYLLFRTVHAVMDGQGTLLWAKDFMRCLRGEAPIGHPSTLTVDQLIQSMSAKRRPLPQPDALHPFGRARKETQGRFHWRRITVPKPLDSVMAGRIAVALAERARTHGEGTVRINLPTDLRHYRPEERTTGNLFKSLFLEVPPGASPEMMGIRVVQMLYKNEGAKPLGIYANDESGSLDALRVKVFWDLAHLHDTGRYAFSATLSHLGAIKGADLSAPSFETSGAFFIPLVGDSGCVVSLNGLDDHTESCVGLSDRFLGEDQLRVLADLIRAAIAGPS